MIMVHKNIPLESVRTVEQQKEFIKNYWRGKVEEEITAAAAVFWIVAAGKTQTKHVLEELPNLVKEIFREISKLTDRRMPAIVHLLCKHLHICNMPHLISRVLPNLQQPYRKIATHVLKKPIHDQKHQEHKSDEVENNHRELSQNVRKRKTVREKVTKEAKPIPPVRIQSVRLSSPHPANYLRPNKTELHCLPVKIHKLRNASTQGTPPPKLLKSTVILPATSKLKPISPVRTGGPSIL